MHVLSLALTRLASLKACLRGLGNTSTMIAATAALAADVHMPSTQAD